jgi:glycosyltransferase involved in cell wall biosynthesis
MSQSTSSLRVLAWPAFVNKTGNPYNSLLYEHVSEFGAEVVEFTPVRLLTGQYDVIHVHWPEGLLLDDRRWVTAVRGGALLGLLRLARMRGASLVWTVHNLGSHEPASSGLATRMWQLFTAEVDGYISLSRSGISAVEQQFPELSDRPGFVVPHGHYRGVYPREVSKREARERLHIPGEAMVFLFVGVIRPYKNVVHCVEAFRQWKPQDARLVVAGNPASDDLRKEITAAAELDERTQTHLAFIPPEEMQYYLEAADAVVLPYTDILNSGTALLALSFDRPVIVPDRGAMGELRREVGANWVYTYENHFGWEVFEAASQWLSRTERSAQAPLEQHDWEEIARQTLEAYTSIRGSGSQMPRASAAFGLDG